MNATPAPELPAEPQQYVTSPPVTVYVTELIVTGVSASRASITSVSVTTVQFVLSVKLSMRYQSVSLVYHALLYCTNCPTVVGVPAVPAGVVAAVPSSLYNNVPSAFSHYILCILCVYILYILHLLLFSMCSHWNNQKEIRQLENVRLLFSSFLTSYNINLWKLKQDRRHPQPLGIFKTSPRLPPHTAPTNFLFQRKVRGNLTESYRTPTKNLSKVANKKNTQVKIYSKIKKRYWQEWKRMV